MNLNTHPSQIYKRDGLLTSFDANKILSAIQRSGEATQEFDTDEAKLLTAQVVKVLSFKFDRSAPSVEDVQDVVESTLISANHPKTARAYAVYREMRGRARKDKHTVIDVASSINEYLGKLDWRVNANANQGYSLGGLILNVSGKVIANYWLNYVYPSEAGKAHREGDLHIHDLDMLSGYCAGWSLRTLLTEGFNGVPNKVESNPPKHMSSAIGQIVNFLGTLQNEWAGAQAFSSFDTYMAPFIRKDKLPYIDVKQCIQELIYNLNVPSRWGTQTPFTNLTFDWTCPEDLADQNPVIGGEEMPFTYGELQSEMDMINKAYIEVMSEGDAKGRIFTFPIPTYNITKDFTWDTPNADLLFEMTAKYGLPYFQNFLKSDLEPKMVRSMCCRLQLDLSELLKRGNGLFGSAEQTGSIGVVTLNCARLGYLHKNFDALLEATDNLLNLSRNCLEIKRKEVQRLMDNGLYPFTKRYLGSLRNHFSTIGVNGINEMIRNFTGNTEDVTTEKGEELAVKFLDHIRKRMTEFQGETGHLYNLEATPAEGTTYRFAKEDQKRFGTSIIQAGTPEAPYYTNSSQLPVDFTADPFEALEKQEALQRKYTGGTVLHLYMGERISNSEACKKIVKKALSNYALPYITITPTFSICPTHGYLAGEVETCPTCGSTCEVWTRVMGYHRPKTSFNIGKKSEYSERICFEEPK